MKEALTILLTVLGGLGVFLLGMKHLSEGLQATAGGGLRKFMANATKHRIVGVASGIVSTIIVQSSSIITVMIEEDWTMIVETMPLKTPTMRCFVAFAMNFRSPPPAVACKPSDKCFIPSRKTPSPPSTVRSIVRASFIASYAKST